jgi:bifunctional non-homologous end joining protein LigD
VTKRNPFAEIPREALRALIFVAPKLVCEVAFAGWTRDHVVRQGSFQGLREDKPARSIAREQVVPMKAVAAKSRAPKAPAKKAPAKKSASDEIAGVRLTHPDRVLYPDQGITKRLLAEYYVAVADRMLPHVADRPLSIVRCPDGTKGACFYQKHLSAGMAGPVRTVPIKETSGTSDYVTISDVSGLVALMQFGVLEIHPWNARNENVDACDRLVFDLDPAPEVAWADVVAATRDVKERLDAVGLASFLKTTGGKGMHVVVPLAPAVTWDVAKAFAKGLADAMAADAPDRYIAKMTKVARTGKIFIDYLRNQHGATAVAAYSTRARPGAPVSTPLEWSELTARIKSDRFHIADIAKRPKTVWKGYFDVAQTIDERVARTLRG